MREVPLPRNRTATRVSNLPTRRVSLATRVRARASERNASSALNEFSSSPQARLVRRVYAYVRAYVRVCVYMRVCSNASASRDGQTFALMEDC